MSNLTDRLRGNYNIPVHDGAGPLNGSDTYFRKFETPPIQHEAADAIEQLKAENAALLKRVEIAEAVITMFEGNRNCNYCNHADHCLEAIGDEELCTAYFTPIATAEYEAARGKEGENA